MSLQLNISQIEKLMNAVFMAFPLPGELEQMVLLKLGKMLDEIIDVGKPRKHLCFQLVIWANSQGMVEDLIRGAHATNPGNPWLKQCMAWLPPAEPPSPAAPSIVSELLAQQPAPTPQPPVHNKYPFPEVWKFDLAMVDQCVDYIVPRRDLQQQRLFGFVVPDSAEHDDFHKNFCEKLKQLVGRKQVTIADYYAYSQKETGNIFQRHLSQITTREKPRLQDGDVVCVVKVFPKQKKKVSDYAQQLWTALQQRFSDEGEHSLIVILFTLTDFVLPPGMMRLDPPRFSISDVYNWTDDVEASLGWGSDFRDKWRSWLIQDSMWPGDMALDVDLTYANLSLSLTELRNRDSLSPDAVLAKLRGR